nr:hypothetical protein [Escherichia coli]
MSQDYLSKQNQDYQSDFVFYDNNADRLFADYISLDFYSIFQDVEEFILQSKGVSLDVGSGSGRDAAVR